MPEYKLLAGSPQEEFGNLRTKVQVFGGAFANGKTAAAVVQKVLKIAIEYPGANILVARSTYPKLNDTIRKEFLKWCPPKWIKSFPLSKNADNTCHFANGTTINFRYVAQQGKGGSDGEQGTSNLLSATYDLIVIDQIEDPEIVEKDFDDLLGRLRGNAKYVGSDPTMPLTGPRWLVALLNPTRNWSYRRLVEPLLKYHEQGIITDNLMCVRGKRDLPDGRPNPDADKPVLDENGKPQLLISMVHGSTYTNRHNLGEDFIETLESAYRGQMRDRYLYGDWAAYEGLVHPDFGETTHCLTKSQMSQYFDHLMATGYIPQIIEGYDFGIVSPSCYLIGFTDRRKNVFIVDGFYKPEQEMRIEEQKAEIWRIRNEWGQDDEKIFADPAVFRKTQAQKNQGAKTIAGLFGEGDNAVRMRAADNEILRGITKVNTYLAIKPRHENPVTEIVGAPNLYVASELTWVHNEFYSYYWKVNSQGQREDVPIDKNDHAMNVLKYMLAKQPDLAFRVERKKPQTHLHQWREGPDVGVRNPRAHRYG